MEEQFCRALHCGSGHHATTNQLVTLHGRDKCRQGAATGCIVGAQLLQCPSQPAVQDWSTLSIAEVGTCSTESVAQGIDLPDDQ